MMRTYRKHQKPGLFLRERKHSAQTLSKLLILLMVGLLMGTTLTGCTKYVVNLKQEGGRVAIAENDKNTVQAGTPLRYFFIRGSLLGSYDKDGWHSLCAANTDEQSASYGEAFYAKDLLNQKTYYVYDCKSKKLLGVSKQLIWTTGEGGLGSFGGKDVSEILAKYGELYEPVTGDASLPRIFNLPVRTGEELSDLKIPDYSFHTEFLVGGKTDAECLLTSNREIALFTSETIAGGEATDAGRQALSNLFRKEKLENTVPNFTKWVQGDFDNDGKTEDLMISNNPRSEAGYPLLCSNGKLDHLGVFSVLFYQDDDGRIQTLYSDLRPFKGDFKPNKNNKTETMDPDKCIDIDLLTTADLNGDGLYEIIVQKSGWEYGFYLTYAMNEKGQYEVVMRSNYGL